MALGTTGALAAAPATPSKPAAAAPKTMSKADFTKSIDSRFTAVDTNKDGFLSKDEVAAAQAKGLENARSEQQQRLEAEFKKLDTDKNGSLSLAEFKAAAPPVKPSETPDAMIAQFDTNKDGKVSAAEYRAKPLANFDKIDSDHNGVLTAQEVAAARRK